MYIKSKSAFNLIFNINLINNISFLLILTSKLTLILIISVVY